MHVTVVKHSMWIVIVSVYSINMRLILGRLYILTKFWYYCIFYYMNTTSLGHIKWRSFVHTIFWFSTNPFFICGISLLLWNTHNHLCGFGLWGFSERLGLTCLLLITWLCFFCSFWGYIWKRYCLHIGEPSRTRFQGLELGFGLFLRHPSLG